MHLIGPLASGVRGAEGGTAELFQRGTASSATWYSSFETSSGNSSGDPIDLDANGGKEVYVNEVVDVLIYDSVGVLVREFTAGVSAPAVEVRSTSFNGAAYVGGAIAPGNPTTLQAVLDLWVASAGAEDFKVLFGGSAANLSDIASSVGEVLFAVKNYGAVGNGVADDTAEIQAAIDAAEVVGGIVYFNPGTYRTSDAIVVPTGVSLIGAGAGSSIVSLNHASNRIMVVEESLGRRMISGLTFKSAVANSHATWLKVAGRVKFSDCRFDCGNQTACVVNVEYSGTLLAVDFEDCDFDNITGIGNAITSTSSTWINLRYCNFDTKAGVTALDAAATTIVDIGVQGVVHGCDFELTALATGSGRALNCASFTQVTANQFYSGGATYTALYVPGSILKEASNYFASGVVAYEFVNTFTSASDVTLLSRIGRKLEVVDNAALTLTAAQVLGYKTIVVKRTTNADQTITLPGSTIPSGAELDLIVWNESGGNIAAETISTHGVGVAAGVNDNLALVTKIVWAHVEAVGPVAIALSAPYNIGDP